MHPIPPVAHFIWLGERLQWVYALAIRSAAMRGRLESVVLHHDRELSHLPFWQELVETPGVVARKLEPEAIFARTGVLAEPLASLFAELDKPEARANVLRAALLFGEGGVYLDTDTVTIADLSPLREGGGAFCGEEHVVKPAGVVRDRSAATRVGVFARSRLRAALTAAPQGWRAFRKLESLYHLAANNAVLASEPGHAFVGELLERMVATPPERRRVRFALGTHLLQDLVGDYRGAGLRVLGPRVFYPLGPEISMHWFRTTAHPDLSAVLYPETRVVHWYASVRTKHVVEQLDQAYVRRHAGTQLFSDLVLPLLSTP